MNPTDIIFQSISSLTGGLINDITTAIVGILVLSFIMMGADILLDILDSKINSRIENKRLTGHFSVPGIDKEYLSDGKLTMEKSRSSREVSYWGR